tara:strand:+ start:1536 stop:2543 length:1008 start_codon:yes stop_codon:yes gene_type:complete
MPNRIIRDGILTSARVNALSAGGELFYRRLMSVVDDFGRFDGRPEMLRAACYPLRVDKVTAKHVEGWLIEATEQGLVTVYTANGKPFLEVADFRQRTRAKESKCPSPDGHMTVTWPSHDGHMTVTPSEESPQKQGESENDGHMTVTRRSHDSHMRTETETETETETNTEAGAETETRAPNGETSEERNGPAPAEIPTELEVATYGERAGVPEWYARRYWAKKDEAGTWANRHGRPIDWRREMVRWYGEDGRPTQPKANGKPVADAKPAKGDPDAPQSTWEIKTALEAVNEKMKTNRLYHRAEHALGYTWDDDNAKALDRRLRKRKADLENRLLGV